VIYRLSVRAEADLAEIWVYSAEQWNLEQADRYIDALVSRFDWLCDNPQLWKPRPDITEGLYSYPQQSHVIYFRVQGDPPDMPIRLAQEFATGSGLALSVHPTRGVLLSKPDRHIARFDRDRAGAPWADGTCPACLMTSITGHSDRPPWQPTVKLSDTLPAGPVTAGAGQDRTW